jgi:hypothetical protein
MRILPLAFALMLSALSSLGQDSLLVKVMVRPPGYGPPAKAATVLLDGRNAVYNENSLSYELNVPLNRLVNIEVSMPDAEPAEFKFYSRQWKHSNEQLYVQLGDKGGVYFRPVSNSIRPARPDSLRIGIVSEKNIESDSALNRLLDSLGLVVDTVWKPVPYPPWSRIIYPYLALRKKNGESFRSSSDELKVIREKGFTAGIFIDAPEAGLHVPYPLKVTVHKDVKPEEARKLFAASGLSETGFNNAGQFTLSLDKTLGTGAIRVMNELMDSGLIDIISYPAYSGVSLY